jgi:hypothetical protein
MNDDQVIGTYLESETAPAMMVLSAGGTTLMRKKMRKADTTTSINKF